ncbi:hypothetical protein Syun_001375 [Stephania yunnanensis]|uniref:Uncharacterized protein n=1 Tax=Stephania yunnanensis TaxID=152371 RepID=A0AAP0LEL4_9MAGN
MWRRNRTKHRASKLEILPPTDERRRGTKTNPNNRKNVGSREYGSLKRTVVEWWGASILNEGYFGDIEHQFWMPDFMPSTIGCLHELPHSVRLEHRALKLLENWTWQFVMIRPVCSLLMILLQMLGAYPSWVSWTFTIILNVSVSLALYSLVVFYHVFQKRAGASQTAGQILVRQRDCLLLLLAGKNYAERGEIGKIAETKSERSQRRNGP